MKTTDAARADHSARRDDSGRGKQTAVGTASHAGSRLAVSPKGAMVVGAWTVLVPPTRRSSSFHGTMLDLSGPAPGRPHIHSPWTPR